MALKQIDPGIQVAAMAPGAGRTTVPHIVTFSGITATLAKVYRQPDEAMRQSVHNAAMMRRDPMIMGPLLARQQAVALLPWSVVPEDEKDPELREVASKLEDIVRRTPRLTEYFRNLMEAIWYGKQAAQHGWGKTRDRDGRAIRYIQKWVPLLGDKLVFRFDDGKAQFDPDQVGIKVTPAWQRSNIVLGEPDLEYTSEGSAIFLNKWQRTRIAIHKHLVMDGDYIEPWSAGMIHGVGLRHFLYWCWFQKQETLAQLSEVVERTGMGFTIYFYPSGNERAKQEITEIAEQQPNKNQIIMPFDASNPDAYRIEQIPPNTGGITALSHLVDDYFGNWIIRFILGQTLSMRADATGMGSGLSDLQKDSFLQIVRYDATNLEETLTTDLLNPLLLFNFPKYRNVRFFLKIATESSVPAEKLQALQMAWGMGAKIRTQDILDMVGASIAGDGDDTVWNPGVVGAMMQIQDQQKQQKEKEQQPQGQELPPEYQALLQGGMQPQQASKRYGKGWDPDVDSSSDAVDRHPPSIKVTRDANGWHAMDAASGVGAYMKEDGSIHYTHGDPVDVKEDVEKQLVEAIHKAMNPCECEDPSDCECEESPIKYAEGEDDEEDEDDLEPDTTVWAEDIKPLHELGYQPVEKMSDAAWMNDDGELYSGQLTTRRKGHKEGMLSNWDHWHVSEAFPEISSLVGNVKYDEKTKKRSIEKGRRKNSVRHYMTQTDSVLINQDPKTGQITALTSTGFTPNQLSMLAKHLNAGEKIKIGLVDQNDANAKLLLEDDVKDVDGLMKAVAAHQRLLPRQTSPMEGIEIGEAPEGGSSIVPFLQGPEYRPETGKTTMREVYTRKLADSGRRKNPLSLEDEMDREELARSLAHEAIFAMSKDGNAIDWYDKSLQAAIDKLASINTGPDAKAFQALKDKEGEQRIMLKVFMALTSNMTAVAPNLKQAVELYKHWYATGGDKGRGKIKPDFSLQGTAKKAFDKHRILLDRLLDYFEANPDTKNNLTPIQTMERFFSEKHSNTEIGDKFPTLGSNVTRKRYRLMVNGEPVGDIIRTKKEADAAAKLIEGASVEPVNVREPGRLKVSGELKGGTYSMLPGASIFGPKLGSFFNNLNGKFDTTTMDRWLMRTINRHLGIILDHNEEALKGQALRLHKLLFAGKGKDGEKAVFYKVKGNKWARMTGSERLKDHWDAVQTGMDALAEAGFDEKALQADLEQAMESGVVDRKGPAAVFSSALHARYKKDYTDKRQAFLAAKQLDLNLTQLREAPRTGDERANVRRVMERTRQLVKEKTGKDVEEANLQALLWYLEKDLVSHSGLKLARQAATDFQTESEKLYDQETGAAPEQRKLFHYERNGHGSGSAQRYSGWNDRGGVRGLLGGDRGWIERLVGVEGEEIDREEIGSDRTISPYRYALDAMADLMHESEWTHADQWGRRAQGAEQYAEGTPPRGKRLFNTPHEPTARIAQDYIQKNAQRIGITTPGRKIIKLDEERSKKIADAYAALKHDPNDPEVRRAYEALAAESADQLKAMLDAGYKVEMWQGEGQPPYESAQDMIDDLDKNKHMYVFSTEEGYGEHGITDEMRKSDPMLGDSGFKDANGRPMLLNDAFRAVHDFFGHAEMGNGFGPVGEETAWQMHSRMFSPWARHALTTETRGQNSWVNFGSHAFKKTPQGQYVMKGDEGYDQVDAPEMRVRRDDGSIPKAGDKDWVHPSQRPYAPQKAALLPDDIVFDYNSHTAEGEDGPSRSSKPGQPDRNWAQAAMLALQAAPMVLDLMKPKGGGQPAPVQHSPFNSAPSFAQQGPQPGFNQQYAEGGSPDQYAHDTDEWKAWAGDAAGNVVENFHPASEEASPDRIQTGKPIVVKGYHGTPRGKIDQFDPNLRASTTGAASASIGDFHSGSKETAASYKSGSSYPETFYSLAPGQAGFAMDHVWRAKREWMDKNEDSPDYRTVGEMGSAEFLKYLNKKDPEHFETVSYGALQHAGHKGPVNLSFRKPALLQNYIRMMNPYVHDHQGGKYRDADYYDIIRKAKANGHDGVLILNTRDRSVDKDNSDPTSKDHVIVSFEPNQVKAASNKRPTDDPRLKYADGEQLKLPLNDEPAKQSPDTAEQMPAVSETQASAYEPGQPGDFDPANIESMPNAGPGRVGDTLGSEADDPTLGAEKPKTEVAEEGKPAELKPRPPGVPELKEPSVTRDQPLEPAWGADAGYDDDVQEMDEPAGEIPKDKADPEDIKRVFGDPVGRAKAGQEAPKAGQGAPKPEPKPAAPMTGRERNVAVATATSKHLGSRPTLDQQKKLQDKMKQLEQSNKDHVQASKVANSIFKLNPNEINAAKAMLESGESPADVLSKVLGPEENYKYLEYKLSQQHPDIISGPEGSDVNRKAIAELITGTHPELQMAGMSSDERFGKMLDRALNESFPKEQPAAEAAEVPAGESPKATEPQAEEPSSPRGQTLWQSMTGYNTPEEMKADIEKHHDPDLDKKIKDELKQSGFSLRDKDKEFLKRARHYVDRRLERFGNRSGVDMSASDLTADDYKAGLQAMQRFADKPENKRNRPDLDLISQMNEIGLSTSFDSLQKRMSQGKGSLQIADESLAEVSPEVDNAVEPTAEPMADQPSDSDAPLNATEEGKETTKGEPVKPVAEQAPAAKEKLMGVREVEQTIATSLDKALGRRATLAEQKKMATRFQELSDQRRYAVRQHRQAASDAVQASKLDPDGINKVKALAAKDMGQALAAIGDEKAIAAMEQSLQGKYPDVFAGAPGSAENREALVGLLTGTHPMMQSDAASVNKNTQSLIAQAANDVSGKTPPAKTDDTGPIKVEGGLTDEEQQKEAPEKKAPLKVDPAARKATQDEYRLLEGVTADNEGVITLPGKKGDKQFKQFVPANSRELQDHLDAAMSRDPNFDPESMHDASMFWIDPDTNEVITLNELKDKFKQEGSDFNRSLQLEHGAKVAWHNGVQDLAKSFGYIPDNMNFDRKSVQRMQDTLVTLAARTGENLNNIPHDQQVKRATEILNDHREKIGTFLERAGGLGFPGGPSDDLLKSANNAGQWLVGQAMEAGWKPSAEDMKKGGITPEMAGKAMQHLESKKAAELLENQRGLKKLLNDLGGSKNVMTGIFAIIAVMMMLNSMRRRSQ